MKAMGSNRQGKMQPARPEKTAKKSSRKEFMDGNNDIDFINRVIDSMEGFKNAPGFLDESHDDFFDFE